MRNEPLTGYLLHHKAYKENRALYYFFTQSHGVVHGVGKKGMPLFAHLQLFASGKRSLKTMSQIQPLAPQTAITGQNLYAGFYLNELLWKLLADEDAMPILWDFYQKSLDSLREPLDGVSLRLLLRYFEQALFTELGYAIALTTDNQDEPIEPALQYRFIPDEGFHVYIQPQYDGKHNDKNDVQASEFAASSIFTGQSLLAIADYLQDDDQQIDQHTLQTWTRLHRRMTDHLLDYQPLQSRELWQQQARYR